MRIAFAGNPNSGKTTMFNALTGKSERVGNWAGVTVDKKEAPIRRNFCEGEQTLIAVDLPGAYSMSPFTGEESVTRAYITGEHPDAIVNIVDATNLSRSLFFTTQLLELGVPVVVALNKSDVNAKKQTEIDVEALSRALCCPVIETVSTDSDKSDLERVVKTAASLKGKGQKAPYVQGEVDLSSREAVAAADRRRFAFVGEIVARVEKRKVLTRHKNAQDKMDDFLTHPVSGLAVFALVMFLVFDISQSTLGPALADMLVGWIEAFQEIAAGWAEGAHPLLYSLLIDGIIGGVGAVVGFLPLVMVMYFLIALLEDCGYMARATIVLDPLFKKVGLSGKSVIPFIVGTGCAIPGVMACRTIRNERERRATAMLAPFMPCGAKLPVIALFAGAFFADSAWVGTLMYFAGIAIIFFGALLINRLTGNSRRKSYFIMELPEYKIPSVPRAAISMLSRGWAYIVKAGTVILVCNTAVQIMQSFTWRFELVEEGMEAASILAGVAGPFAAILVPIVGIRAWQLAAAAITGFIAKENVVGTLAVCYSITNFIDTEELALMGGASEVAAAMQLTRAAALAYLMFNLFTPPCFAALGAMNSEIGDRKWFLGGVALQFAAGFTVSYFVYQIGTLIATGSLGVGFLPGLAAVAAIAAVIAVLIRKADMRVAAEQAAKAKKKMMQK